MTKLFCVFVATISLQAMAFGEYESFSMPATSSSSSFDRMQVEFARQRQWDAEQAQERRLRELEHQEYRRRMDEMRGLSN